MILAEGCRLAWVPFRISIAHCSLNVKVQPSRTDAPLEAKDVLQRLRYLPCPNAVSSTPPADQERPHAHTPAPAPLSPFSPRSHLPKDVQKSSVSSAPSLPVSASYPHLRQYSY